ncbi:MAG: rRNA pseudouridine synthase [Verrucomicrobia bacterium]|nr:rRNA pseudouridine synthase [Verrucomicrobiota bacterium]
MPRLDQLLASLGYGSRREVRALIDEGKVTVAGVVAKKHDAKANAHDVLVDGMALEAPDGLLAMLHKPIGYVCTHADGEGPTIYELLPARWSRRNPPVTSIGRLDKDTSGLLLITDRGELVQKWTSPKSDIEKVYEAEVDKPLSPEMIEIFASGTIRLRGEDNPCLPAKLEIIDDLHARLTITEGRYHQVRRMFASQGMHVEKLHRAKFGEYELGDLKPGEWQMLT